MTEDRARRRPLGLSVIYMMMTTTLFGAMCLIAYVGIEMVYPRKLIEFTKPFMAVEPKGDLRPGQVVTLVVEYCKANDRTSMNGLIFASRGALISLPAFVSALPKGCHRIGQRFQLPPWMPPGSYRAYLTKAYRPSVFSESQVFIESEAFTVVTDPASNGENPARKEPIP